MTLTDFRIDLAQLGACAVTTSMDADFACELKGLRHRRLSTQAYPLAPHFLVHVSEAGSVELPYTQAKCILDWLKRVSLVRDTPDSAAIHRFDKQTKQGVDMASVQQMPAAAVASIVGKSEEWAIASPFLPGDTHALKVRVCW